jgi:hypothetical protein
MRRDNCFETLTTNSCVLLFKPQRSHSLAVCGPKPKDQSAGVTQLLIVAPGTALPVSLDDFDSATLA